MQIQETLNNYIPANTPSCVHIQLFPHAELSPHQAMSRYNRHFVFKPMEIDINTGTTVKMGRKIDNKKDQPVRSTREEQVANNASIEALDSPLESISNFPDDSTHSSQNNLILDGDLIPKTSRKQQLISFRSKVVSRSHAEFWLGKDNQVYFRDSGSSSGTFLNRLRLSPSGKESRPYPLKSGDVIQLGVDYQGRQDEIYKCVTIKVFITSTGARPKVKTNKIKIALAQLLSSMNPNTDFKSDPLATACCICLSDMDPFQALFLAPCSHCFHYKCCTPLLASGYMFQCPLCRQVANLEADVTKADEDSEITDIAEEVPEVDINQKTMTRSMDIPIACDELDNQPGASLMTPPNNTRMISNEESGNLNLFSVIGNEGPRDEFDLQRMHIVLSDYESAMNRMQELFPGLTDNEWKERVRNARERLM